MAKEGTTRYYSDMQEKNVCRLLEGYQQSNSGAGKFRKGDVVQKEASLLIECKTTTKEKNSISIKKEWIIKNKEEKYSQQLSNGCLALNFGPEQENYFLIDETLMKFLVDKLIEENK